MYTKNFTLAYVHTILRMFIISYLVKIKILIIYRINIQIIIVLSIIDRLQYARCVPENNENFKFKISRHRRHQCQFLFQLFSLLTLPVSVAKDRCVFMSLAIFVC